MADSERHPLASEGSWVELRNARDLRAGDMKRVASAITDPSRILAADFETNDALARELIVNWQLPEPLPLPSVTPGSLDLMRIDDYRALGRLMAPIKRLLFPPAPQPPTPGQDGDPESPTPPSAA